MCSSDLLINIEYKGSKPFEVHLRDTPDPRYTELIPIWKNSINNIDILEKLGYTYIESYDDADGHLLNARLGFMVKE